MFTHLHVHSHFSLLESSIRIKELVEAAANLGMRSLALTDKYVMNGALEFYNEAIAAGIKPVTGCEICMEGLSHLTLLVKNKKGYENLCQIVSRSHIKNPETGPPESVFQTGKPVKQRQNHDIPVVTLSDLKKLSEGLICLSGCSRGALPRFLRANNMDCAKKLTEKLLEIFPKDFYIEIQRYRPGTCNPDKDYISEILINYAHKYSIPVVAVNNVHYLTKKDFRIYRYLTKIKMMGVKKDPLASIINNDEHYLKSEREMRGLFHDIPQAIRNTGIIAEKCNFGFEPASTIIPKFKTPAGESQESYLKKMCDAGLTLRYGKNPPKKIIERFSKEIGIINKTGFAGYLLVVADIARFACENRIPLCGKGSAAGSLVSYILRISNVDPVENNLYFERFLNPERKEPPDIDIDISNRDRIKVIKYLQSKYGYTNIARVSSFVTTKPRASLREAGRILNTAKEEVDNIIKSVPGYNRFFTSEKMYRNIKSSNLINKNSQEYKNITSISARISGYVRHISMHPSAFIVSNYDLCSKIPLSLSETGEIMSQYDMNSISDLGILKIDLINSLSLSLISDTCKKLKKHRDIQVDITNMAYDDSSVYKIMKEGRTIGVFQLESFGIRTLARKIKPACLNDITLLISLYRPGPQQSGMGNNFIERKFGREKTTFVHSDLKPVLEETYGIILYQEQVMQAAMKIAGYSLNEADKLRKAISHLSSKEILAQEAGFMRGAAKKGYDIETAKEVFRLISKFASYGFVKAHAAAYAELSYKTCFLKTHYPAEFLSTILTGNSGYYSKMQYIEEARRLGVNPLLPDINKSIYDFTVEYNEIATFIRIPLIQIKGLGISAADSIIAERRRNGIFKDFFDFYKRAEKNCRITRTSVENLIRIGAFDYTGTNRKNLLITFNYLRSLKKPDIDLEKSRIIQHTKKINDFSLDEKLEMEAEILGFYVSAHPLQHFKEQMKKSRASDMRIIRSGLFQSRIFTDRSNDRSGYRQNSSCIFSAGIVISKRTEKTKDKKNMMFCTMEDEDGMYEAVFFPDSYQRNLNIVMNSNFIIIKGRLHFRDNNISIIAKDVISIAAFRNSLCMQDEDDLKAGFISESAVKLNIYQ